MYCRCGPLDLISRSRTPHQSPTCAGYLELKEVFLYGALMAVVNLGAWGGVGAVWWKLLGLF